MMFDLQRFSTINAINNGEVITIAPGSDSGGSGFSDDITNAVVSYFSPFDLKTHRIEAPFADEDEDNIFPPLMGLNISALADGNNFVADTENNRIMSGPSSYNTQGKSVGFYTVPPQEKYYKLRMLIANYGYSGNQVTCYITDDISKAQDIGNSTSGLYQAFYLQGKDNSDYSEFSVTLQPGKTFYVCFIYKENRFTSGYDNRCYISTTAIQLLAPWIIDGIHCEALLDGQNFAVFKDSTTQDVFISSTSQSTSKDSYIGIIPLGKADYSRKVTVTLMPYTYDSNSRLQIYFRLHNIINYVTKTFVNINGNQQTDGDMVFAISIDAGKDYYLEFKFTGVIRKTACQPKIKNIIIEPNTTAETNAAELKTIVENYLPDLLAAYRKLNNLENNKHVSFSEFHSDQFFVTSINNLYESTRSRLSWDPYAIGADEEQADPQGYLHMYGDQIGMYITDSLAGTIYRHYLMSDLGTGQSLTADTTAIAYDYSMYRLSETGGFVLRESTYEADGRDGPKHVIPFRINHTGKPTLGSATSILGAAPTDGSTEIVDAVASTFNPYSVMYIILYTDVNGSQTYQYTVVEYNPIVNNLAVIVKPTTITIKYAYNVSWASKACMDSMTISEYCYVPVVQRYGDVIEISSARSYYPCIYYMQTTYNKNEKPTVATDYIMFHHGLFRSAPVRFTISTSTYTNGVEGDWVNSGTFVPYEYKHTGINISSDGRYHYIVAWKDGFYPYVSNWEKEYFRVYSVDYATPTVFYNPDYSLYDIEKY